MHIYLVTFSILNAFRLYHNLLQEANRTFGKYVRRYFLRRLKPFSLRKTKFRSLDLGSLSVS